MDPSCTCKKILIFSCSWFLCSSPALCLHILTIYILIQSNNLAWRFELSYCPLLPVCQGTCWDAELEGTARKWPGMLYCPVTNSISFFRGFFLAKFLHRFEIHIINFTVKFNKKTFHWWFSWQLRIEQKRGRVFVGWNEGKIYFPPTYKYSTNSDRYAGDDMHPKEKRRTPAW